MRRGAALVVATIAAMSACTEDTKTTSSSASSTRADQVANASCPVDDLIACAKDSTLGERVPDQPTKAAGEPIVIGMINQDQGPSSFPELTTAVQAGVDFVNEQLGGVDGRPLQLLPCDINFSPAGSQQCAQQIVNADAVAVQGGIDVFGDGIQVLADNGIPFVGGIPVSTLSATSPNSFQFSGGAWGAFVAFADYAAQEMDAKTASIAYGEFGSTSDAAGYAERVFQSDDVKSTSIPFPTSQTDLIGVLTQANEGEPDALVVGTVDRGCGSVYQGAQELEITGQLFLVGACASPKIIAAAGDAAVDGTIFNVEGPIATDDADADTRLYGGVIEKYGKGMAPQGAGTVSFRSFMNLWMQLVEIGAADITPATITERFATAKDVPSFMGHAYTCDPAPITALPALCAPQQILARYTDGNLEQITDWIDVERIIANLPD